MRMRRALEMFIVEGVYTTIPLHRIIVEDDDFKAGRIDTKYLDRLLPRLQAERAREKEAVLQL